ncbi:hypothetical protein LTR66_004236 [Elasticomyces elasticus]|nr:hypothetical protein LTR66_004236 [Elasticomyces elasticus]
MPFKSRWTVDIPTVTLPTFLFTSPTAPLSETPLMIDPEKPERYHLSHHTYRLWSKRLAAGLRKAGFQLGERLLLYSGNTIYFPTVFMGTICAGGVFTGANPTYVARELAYQLQDSGARYLISAEASLDTALEAADSIDFPRDRVFVFDNGYATFDNTGKSVRGIRHWTSLLSSVSEAESFAWEESSTYEQANRTICLNYSSGTTGVPKGVEITHTNYIANTLQVNHFGTLLPREEYVAMLSRARALCFLPMYHAYAQTYFCVGCVVKSVPVYVMQKFDFVKMLECVQRFRITALTMVPPIVVAMAKSPVVKNYDLSSVEDAGCGAAPLGREVCIEFERLWPDGKVNVKQGWGMTEVTCSAAGWDPNERSETFAVGELNPNCEGKIVTDDVGLNEVAQGERGELWIRAPNVMKGYWNRPDATAETLTEDGWLKTGDIAYRDHDGKLFIVDRKKELIKVKGNQVAPAELEAQLLEHPAVVDAAVVGVTIHGEERPRAYLVKKPDTPVSAKEIATFMEKRVSPHKRLVGGVHFIDAIPKNPSGKILRKVLREKAQAEVGDSEARAQKL